MDDSFIRTAAAFHAETLDNPIRRHEADGFEIHRPVNMADSVNIPAVSATDAKNSCVPELGSDGPDLGLRESVLVEAQGLVHGDRNAAYGSPLEDWSRTAGMVSAMLAHKLREPLTAEDCAMILCCVKLSRQQHIQKRDNMTDLAGYAECVQWMLDERAARGA